MGLEYNDIEIGMAVSHLSNNNQMLIVSRKIRKGSRIVCEWILPNGRNVTAVFHVKELEKYKEPNDI